jgi:hypothetical protein
MVKQLDTMHACWFQLEVDEPNRSTRRYSQLLEVYLLDSWWRL